MNNTENDIEIYLVKKVKNMGGECLKFTSPGTRGVPDRICILPGNKIFFVETKKPKGGVLSKIQKVRINRLESLGAECYVLNTKEAIDRILSIIDAK